MSLFTVETAPAPRIRGLLSRIWPFLTRMVAAPTPDADTVRAAQTRQEAARRAADTLMR